MLDDDITLFLVLVLEFLLSLDVEEVELEHPTRKPKNIKVENAFNTFLFIYLPPINEYFYYYKMNNIKIQDIEKRRKLILLL